MGGVGVAASPAVASPGSPMTQDMPSPQVAARARTGARAVVDTPSGGVGRVLVVGDEQAELRPVADAARLTGHQIRTARSAAEAIEHALVRRPDVIVASRGLPDGDGLDLLADLRALGVGGPMVVTARAPTMEEAIEAVGAGAFRYVPLPVGATELAAILDRALEVGVGHRWASVDARGPGGRRLAGQLDAALAGLKVLYLPVIAATDGRIVGYEALARTPGPPLGHPKALTRAAARLGRLRELGRAVRGQVGEVMARRPEAGDIYINLHPRDLLDPDLLSGDSVPHGFARRVVLEVTERQALKAMRDIRGRVAVLRERGFRISVDNMGSGYAGLNTLAALAPDVVKLDRALVQGAEADATNRRVVRALVGACHDLGMRVVAEGVETEAQREAMTDAGCDLLQGFHFGHPQPL